MFLRYSMAANVAKQRPQSVHGEDVGGGGGGDEGGGDGWRDEGGVEVWREVQSMPVSPCLSPRLSSKRFVGGDLR